MRVFIFSLIWFFSPGDAPKDTFISFGSWNAALLAAGGVCKAVEFVCAPGDKRKVRNAFVAVRPPGHHAGPTGHARSNTQGFCILNNVAIGAKYALDKFGLQRVAIVDIDVHAGNGTVECVEKEPNILFISLHCEDAYPFDADHTPEMYNLGPNILNVGFKSNPTRRKFFKLFEEQALPRLEAHKPELILISAGFDAHMDDPTGVGALTSKDYIDITEKLKAVADKHCNGRIVSVLEGGYNLDALKQSVLAHICALMRSKTAPTTPKGNNRKKGK
jgi:acetoin utilization deacetylase AcuC-like enzyme